MELIIRVFRLGVGELGWWSGCVEWMVGSKGGN